MHVGKRSKSLKSRPPPAPETLVDIYPHSSIQSVRAKSSSPSVRASSGTRNPAKETYWPSRQPQLLLVEVMDECFRNYSFSIASQAVVRQHQSSLLLLLPHLPNLYGQSLCPVPRAHAIPKSFHPRGVQSPTPTLAWTARHYHHHLPLTIHQAPQTTY